MKAAKEEGRGGMSQFDLEEGVSQKQVTFKSNLKAWVREDPKRSEEPFRESVSQCPMASGLHIQETEWLAYFGWMI